MESTDISFLRCAPKDGAAVENPPATEMRQSRRTSELGWKNFADLAFTYLGKRTNVEDNPVKLDWLPVHRYFILLVGLRGRYDRRLDRGRVKPPYQKIGSGIGIRESDPEEENFWMEYGEHKEGILFGTTGIMQGRLLDASINKVYFALHPDSNDPSSFNDPTPFSELFLLSIGYLPRRDHESPIFDYASFSRLFSRENRRKGGSPQFWRFDKVRENDVKEEYRQLAELIRADIDNVWSLQKSDVSDPCPEWYPKHENQIGQERFIWRSDVHRVAYAILSLSLGPQSFLFPSGPSHLLFCRLSLEQFLQRLLEAQLPKQPQDGEEKRSERPVKRGKGEGVNQSIEAKVLKLIKTSSPPCFSRQRAELYYELHSKVVQETVEEPSRVLGILTITSKKFRRQVLESPGNSWKIQLSQNEKTVRVTSPAGTTCYPMDFEEVFHKDFEVFHKDFEEVFHKDFGGLKEKQCDVRPSVIIASTQLLMFHNSLSSDPLVDFVSTMHEVVDVSAAPKLKEEDTWVEIWDSDNAPSEETASGSDGKVVYSDSEDEYEIRT